MGVDEKGVTLARMVHVMYSGCDQRRHLVYRVKDLLKHTQMTCCCWSYSAASQKPTLCFLEILEACDDFDQIFGEQ